MVMRPSLSDSDRKKLIESVKDLVKDMKITKEEDMGQKPLAYKIKKEVAGVFHTIHMESEQAIPQDLERKLLHNDKILRHLVIRSK